MKHHHLELLKNMLPVVPGMLDKKELFSSAVLVLLAFLDGEYHFILEKRSSNLRQGGEICFPGGQIDPRIDGNSEEAAIRETVEELGISRGIITIIGRLDTFIAPLGISIEAFVGVAQITNLEELKIASSEVEYVFSVPVSYFVENEPKEYDTIVRVHPSYIDENGKEVVLFPAKELGLGEMYTRPWGGRRLKMYIYNVKDEIIWGITARFINDMANKLKQLPKDTCGDGGGESL